MADVLGDAMRAFAATEPQGDPLGDAMREYASKPRLVPMQPQAQNDPGMMRVIGNGLVKGAAGFGDMVGNTLVNLENLGRAGQGFVAGQLGAKGSELPELLPADTLSGFRKLADATGLTSDSREPTTAPQRVADFAAQVVGGGGVNPRALTRAILQRKVLQPLAQAVTPVIGGTAGGVTSELVNNSVDPETWYGRTASAVLPAVANIGGSYPTAHMSPATVRAAQTTKNVTPAQWDAAKALAGKAALMGTPLTAIEALQFVTGNNPGLQSLGRVTEQSAPGVDKLAPAFAQRPIQNAALFGKVADGIYPNETDPGAIAGTLQNAANGAIGTARKFGNDQAAPFYAASSNDPSVTIPMPVWNKLLTDNPDVATALQNTNGAFLGGVHGAQPGSLQWLDAAKKYLDSQASSRGQQLDAAGAANASKAAAAITAAVDPVSPLYAAARNIVADNMQNNVAPMQAGQIGKLAGTNDFVGQAGQLLPTKPMDVTPGVIAKTAQTIGAQDPTILPRFTAQYLRGTFNEANQNLQNGANQQGGAKFAAQVAGNDTQAQNLTQLLQSSGVNPTGLLDALDVWRAQGTRPAVGSATTFNNGETGLLSGGGLSNFEITKPFVIPGELLSKVAASTSTGDLANALVPDAGSVGRFQDLARANSAYSPIARSNIGYGPMQQAVLAAEVKATNPPQPDLYAQYMAAFNAAPDAATKIALGNQYAAALAASPQASAAATQ
jgi:hypothetical protein